jgi:hypothetical protein
LADLTNTNVLDQPFATGGRHWPLRVETAGSIEVEEMAAYGATSSLPDAPAKVG